MFLTIISEFRFVIIIGPCISIMLVVVLVVLLLGIIFRKRIKQKNQKNQKNLDGQAPGILLLTVLSMNL